MEFLKFRGAKLSFAQKTLMPYSPLLLSPLPPYWRRPVRRGEGAALACRRHARWRQCRCGWAPPSGAAASAGGAVPPGGRPCGGVSPSGAAAACAAALRRSARGLPAPPAASLLQAGRRPAAADAAPVLPAFGCASCTQIEGSNYCCPFSLLRQRF